jgi:putative phosphoserine phosphatase/1-acylglycerol-3-phosphate O-acyltransferase
MAVTTQFLRGIEEATYVELGETAVPRADRAAHLPRIAGAHRGAPGRGHTVAIISSATPYQVDPAAADLGIENVLCTQLEVEDGVFTGSVLRPTCFGQGKVDAAESLAERSRRAISTRASSIRTAPTTSCSWSRSVGPWH